MIKVYRGFAILAFLAVTTTCSGTVLNFEGIAPYPNNNDVYIQNYYNGGTASNGNIGPNYGVTFSTPALLLCLNTPTNGCSDTSRGGQGDPSSQLGAVLLQGSSTTMDVSGGFTGLSFYYTSPAGTGSADVYDGPDGTGNLLASSSFPVNPSGSCPDYGADYCPFFPVGVSFSGVAESVVFSVVGPLIFDDIAFGSPTPGEVPEPATLGMAGVALALIATRFRSRK